MLFLSIQLSEQTVYIIFTLLIIVILSNIVKIYYDKLRFQENQVTWNELAKEDNHLHEKFTTILSNNNVSSLHIKSIYEINLNFETYYLCNCSFSRKDKIRTEKGIFILANNDNKAAYLSKFGKLFKKFCFENEDSIFKVINQRKVFRFTDFY